MVVLNTVLQEIKSFVNKHDDDFVDRFNNRYTVILLATFMVLIAGKQYYGDPIVCWTPAQFTSAHTEYANTICWTHGTYPVTTDQPYHTVDRSKVLPYYQWIPFILLFQAACFMFPHLVWHTLSKSAGIDVTSLAENALRLDDFDTENRGKTVNQIARHIQIALNLKYEYQPEKKKYNLKDRLTLKNGYYLYAIYMLVKAIYILNLVFQIILMDSFFGFRNYSFGFEFLRKFLVGDDYSRIDKAFPRVTFCDFKIRNLGDNIHQHSVQCALPINLFNEKFFILLWFWLLFLIVMTVFNFFSWFKILFPGIRRKTIANYLRSHNKLGASDKDKDMFHSFVDDYCHLDGAFIFSIIRRNTNYITTSEIISNLYTKYCPDYIRSQNTSRFEFTNKKNDLSYNNTESVGIGMVDYDETFENKPFRINENEI